MATLLQYCFLFLSVVVTKAEQQHPPPHILFILVDDLGFAEANFNRKVKVAEVMTPNLDQLVEQGINLQRHYVHRMCTPTRTSLQSGRLPVHVNTGLGSPCSDNTGISQNMTGLAEHLKAAGYTTAMAGKWDAGMATPAHTPHGRGYDTSLNYFSHKNDFWSQANMQTCCEKDQTIIDFWHTDKGASSLNSTAYSEFLYRDELLGIIKSHDHTASPLMMFYAPHVAHCPLQLPKAYYDKFDFMTDDEAHCSAQTVKGLHDIDPHYPDLEYKCRQQYHAMVNILDTVVGNLTDAIKAKAGMWENTLVIFSSDNGGPIDLPENAANNWPLRGGKYSVFEGGIRAIAFVSGGFLPKEVRGTTNNEMIHIADWYATLANLAGQDPTDHRAQAAGLPAIDSMDVWPLLSGKVTTSPRKIIPVDKNCVIRGNWKLITSATNPSTWQGPKFPNSTSEVSMYRHIGNLLHDNSGDEGTVHNNPPPRPFPKLEHCYTGDNSSLLSVQQWIEPPQLDTDPKASPGNICTLSRDFKGFPCWNIQESKNRLILWPEEQKSNSLFGFIGIGEERMLVSARQNQGQDGCIGNDPSTGELILMKNCQHYAYPSSATKGWSYNKSSMQIQISTGNGIMCVTSFLNGSQPKPPAPSNSDCSNGCLFDVVSDPTEQNNMYSEKPTLVQNLTMLLAVLQTDFFSNNDTFVSDCPDGTKDCACWMATNKYGGFMGPYAQTGLDKFSMT